MESVFQERFFGIFNFSAGERTAWMKEEGAYVDLMTGKEIKVENPVVPGHGFYWIKSK